MKMKESLIYVDDSRIHGKGLFARKYIDVNQQVIFSLELPGWKPGGRLHGSH
jgi:hypothetical protein